MKILFYSPVQLSSGGGCERWHCDITNSIKKIYGHDVEIVTANLGSPKWDRSLLENELRGVRYTKLNFPVFFGVLIWTPAAFQFLYRKFREADCVHFIFGFMGQDIMMALLKLATRKKVVVGHHAPIFHSSKIHNFYMRLISRYVMKFFDFHQTLNSSDRNFFVEEWGIKNVYFIPSGIRADKFLNTPKASGPGLNFLLAGRYEHQKGYDLALDAIRLFNTSFPENTAVFRFAGGGSLKGEITRAERECFNVKDLGYVPYDQIPKVYSESDVYLLSSREEPFGLVLIEAWASGMPVLATRTEGPNDMIVEGKNGWFIERISSESIFEGLKNLYLKFKDDKKALASMEAFCRESGEKYTIDNTARRMIETFL